MSCAIILHGPIGSGKTTTCLELVKRGKLEGILYGGILSPRVFHDDKLAGYDCLDLVSFERFPLVRLRDEVEGADWFNFGRLKYSFSTSGFKRANQALILSSKTRERPFLIFLDEFGRLERAQLGLHSGALRVAEAMSDGCVAVFTCRTDLVEFVKKLIRGRARKLIELEPRSVDMLWLVARQCLSELLKI